jgi:hypothetical protein
LTPGSYNTDESFVVIVQTKKIIKLLKFFGTHDDLLLQKALKKYDNKHIQAPGTLTYYNGKKNATNDFIKEMVFTFKKK